MFPWRTVISWLIKTLPRISGSWTKADMQFNSSLTTRAVLTIETTIFIPLFAYLWVRQGNFTSGSEDTDNGVSDENLIPDREIVDFQESSINVTPSIIAVHELNRLASDTLDCEIIWWIKRMIQFWILLCHGYPQATCPQKMWRRANRKAYLAIKISLKSSLLTKPPS